jgi:hypothetical protein
MRKIPRPSAFVLSTLLASAPLTSNAEVPTPVDEVSQAVSSLVNAINQADGVCYLQGLHGPNSIRILGSYNNITSHQSRIERIPVPAGKTLPPALENTVANLGFLVMDAINLEINPDGSMGWTSYRGVFDPDFDAKIEDQFGFETDESALNFYETSLNEALAKCADIHQV